MKAGFHFKRYPDIDVPAHFKAVECGRRNTDDGERVGVDADDFAREFAYDIHFLVGFQGALTFAYDVISEVKPYGL